MKRKAKREQNRIDHKRKHLFLCLWIGLERIFNLKEERRKKKEKKKKEKKRKEKAIATKSSVFPLHLSFFIKVFHTHFVPSHKSSFHVGISCPSVPKRHSNSFLHLFFSLQAFCPARYPMNADKARNNRNTLQ